MDKQKFGIALKCVLIKRDMSQVEAAIKAGTNPVTFGGIINGRASDVSILFFTLAESLGIKASDLVKEIEWYMVLQDDLEGE